MNIALVIFMVVPLGVYLVVLILATVKMELPKDADDADAPVAADILLTAAAPELEFEPAVSAALESDAPSAEIPTLEAEAPAPAVLESDTPLVMVSALDAQAPASTDLETAHAESDDHDAESGLSVDNLAETNALPPTESVDRQSEPTVVVAGGESILPESAPAVTSQSDDEPEAPSEEPIGPIEFPAKGSPKYAFDYRGRLWVEKKRKSFFRQLRRPQIPPEEPS